MTADEQQQVKELLNEALDRPQAERAAFLEKACGSNLDLREQDERGLSVEDTAGALGISPRTVKRDWTCARALLYEQLQSEEPETTPEK